MAVIRPVVIPRRASKRRMRNGITESNFQDNDREARFYGRVLLDLAYRASLDLYGGSSGKFPLEAYYTRDSGWWVSYRGESESTLGKNLGYPGSTPVEYSEKLLKDLRRQGYIEGHRVMRPIDRVLKRLRGIRAPYVITGLTDKGREAARKEQSLQREEAKVAKFSIDPVPYLPRWYGFVNKHRNGFRIMEAVGELICEPVQRSYTPPTPAIIRYVDSPLDRPLQTSRKMGEPVKDASSEFDVDAQVSESIKSAAHGSDMGLASSESERPWWRRCFGS